VDFGDACQVREHAVMELVVRNATAIETFVSLQVDKRGVRDETARELTAKRRVAAGAGAGGRGGGGRDASLGGARALGGLAGGDGVVAATLATTNARGLEHGAPKKRGDEETRNANENANAVFGAVATVGPDAFAATMRDAANSENTTMKKTFHLPGGLPGGGELSFSGGREIPEDVSRARLESKSKTRGVRPAFARPKLSEAHEKVSFSRGAGIRMAAARDSASADARALREAGDAGVAFALSASSGVLPAFGEFRVLVTCVADAPGEYSDFVSCAVGHLPERRIPLRAGRSGLAAGGEALQARLFGRVFRAFRGDAAARLRREIEPSRPGSRDPRPQPRVLFRLGRNAGWRDERLVQEVFLRQPRSVRRRGGVHAVAEPHPLG
jgi:hypothetical protein